MPKWTADYPAQPLFMNDGWSVLRRSTLADELPMGTRNFPMRFVTRSSEQSSQHFLPFVYRSVKNSESLFPVPLFPKNNHGATPVTADSDV